MAIVTGADWGRGVYVVARVDLDRMDVEMSTVPSAEELIRFPCDLLAVDMPIGLSETGPRPCDAAARTRIPGRKSSVFNVPVRGVLNAASYAEASARSRELTGQGLSPQSHGFMRHIREMDAALRAADAATRERVWEIHPEVSFAELSGGATLVAAKKTDEGAKLRIEALGNWLWPARIEAALSALPTKLAARDDILDALAAAWTATRLLRDEGRTVTEGIPRDATGLRMTIAY